MTQSLQNGNGAEVRVLLTQAARKQFDDLPCAIQTRALNLFRRLGGWPNVSGVKALAGPWAGQYRMRTGDYRVQFRVLTVWGKDEAVTTILIVKMGHRDGFYDA